MIKKPKGAERWHPYTPANATDIRKTFERVRQRLRNADPRVVKLRPPQPKAKTNPPR